MFKILIGSFIALMIGRVVIPVEDAPITPHLIYEIMSHMWVGFFFAIMVLRPVNMNYRFTAGYLLGVASLIELAFFLVAKQ